MRAAPFQRRAPRSSHRHLVFGVNDGSLTTPWGRQDASGLGLDQYATSIQWRPGTKITGNELGSIPANQSVLAYLYGNKAAAPRTKAQRREYANYARALTKRYPNIRELQVWNEPNLRGNWDTKAPLSYLSLLATTYDRMRGSGVKIASPGQYPSYQSQLRFAGQVRRYMRGTQRKRPLFDIYASHPYWDYDKTRKVEQAQNRLFKGTAQPSPNRGLKYWWTESGLNAPNPTAPKGAYYGTEDNWVGGTTEQQAKRIGTLATLAMRDPTIGAMFNFLLTDEGDLGRWQSGLLDPKGNRKPAYLAYQQAIKTARARGF